MPEPVGPAEARRVAEAALDLPGADAVEVLFLHEWGGLTRFANSSIHQSTWSEDTGLRVRVVTEGRVDGLLLAFAAREDPFLGQMSHSRIPLVMVNRRVEGAQGSVVVDDRRGAELAVEHLHVLGHEQIGYIASPLSFDTGRRRGALAVEQISVSCF